MERRLTAILAADVVGYSRLMDQDEPGTYLALTKHRDEVFVPLIKENRGRIFKLVGDAVLAEFGSAVDAVKCAAEIQSAMHERSIHVPENKRIVFRIGVNLGDVIIEEDDIYGDGINIAARLESQAAPGGVTISATVFEIVRNKLEYGYEFQGEQRVKNIEKPVGIYSLKADQNTENTNDGQKRGRAKGVWYVAGACAIVAAAVVAILLWQRPWVPTIEPASIDRMAFALPDKPSLAVLPFTNNSGDPEQEYFVDGITDDLITDLSRISGLFIIARNSSFVYKESPPSIRTVAEELGVRYVLEGSVRRSDETVRINAQLIDATTGGNLWAARYDGDQSDVFELQDRVVAKIVSQLEINILGDEGSTFATQAETDIPEAYDEFLRGWSYFQRQTSDDFKQAIPHLERAISLDPEYGRAYAGLAAIHRYADDKGHLFPGLWLDLYGLAADEMRLKGDAYLESALQYPTPLAHQVASVIRIREGRFEEAIAEANAAVALDSNDPVGHLALAKALIYGGQPAEGERAIRTAMRLDPHYPASYQGWLGLAQFSQDQYTSAENSFRTAIRGNPEDDWALVLLISTLGQLSQFDEAQSLIDTLNELRERQRAQIEENTDYVLGVDILLLGPYIMSDTDFWPFRYLADRERLRHGLRIAGIPESADGVVSPLTVPGAATVTTDEAKVLFDAGVPFVDVRNLPLYKLGHVERAYWLDIKTDFTREKLLEIVNRDEEIVIFCNGEKCLRSSQASALAVSWGFTAVYFFRDGFPSWKAKGYPVAIE